MYRSTYWQRHWVGDEAEEVGWRQSRRGGGGSMNKLRGTGVAEGGPGRAHVAYGFVLFGNLFTS